MAEIFHFVPKFRKDVNQNLQDFIHMSRYNLVTFGEDLHWDDWYWKGVVQFTKSGVNSRAASENDALDSSFIDFAKAYFRYQQSHKPTRRKNEIFCLRALEHALLQVNGKAHITDVSVAALDEAVSNLYQNYSKANVYHGARELERLAKFVSHNNLCYTDVSSWKNPVPKEKESSIQIGKGAEAEKNDKLPSQEALDALAYVFSINPDDPRDIFTSSTFAMTMCAPARITEILELPVDCEIEQKDKHGNLRYGWRFYSGKGYGGDIKWIPDEMVTIAKEAVRRIKKLTEPSRKLAKWIEQNPQKFYPHENCPNVSNDELLTKYQVSNALGHNSKKALQRKKFIYRDYIYTLNDLWQYVLSQQPTDFPWINKKKKVKYSNALFCMNLHLLSNISDVNPVLLWKPTVNVFNNDLSPRESLKHNSHRSIFDRYGWRDSQGERLKLKSHQARHLLNTIAQRGGLSQLQIAKWSGRADPKQNRYYNHMTNEEIVEQIKDVDNSKSLFGPDEVVSTNLPISIEQYQMLEKGAVHVTEFGVCVHDFVISPCNKYRDCPNCFEHVYIKGDNDKFDRILNFYERIKEQFDAAEKALQEGVSGADRWYEYHRNTLTHLSELIKIMQDPNIEDGSLIRLINDQAFNPLNRIISSKFPNSVEGQHLNDMKRQIGGGFG